MHHRGVEKRKPGRWVLILFHFLQYYNHINNFFPFLSFNGTLLRWPALACFNVSQVLGQRDSKKAAHNWHQIQVYSIEWCGGHFGARFNGAQFGGHANFYEKRLHTKVEARSEEKNWWCKIVVAGRN